MKRLNLGCGRNPLKDWVNIDRMQLPGVDLIAELDDQKAVNLPLEDSSVEAILMSHVLEHIRYPLPLLSELWRVAAPGATLTVVCPYGASDDADEDPTHVRRLFPNSFGFFGQPYYHRADYGYKGDWELITLVLDVGPEYAGTTYQLIMRDIGLYRNIVLEMTATLKAIKPIREPNKELINQIPIGIRILKTE